MLLRRPPSILSIAPILGLCACDGGNGAPPPQPSNQPPSFTSAPSVTVPENSDGIIYTATATDPDGDALAFSLAGGADQSAFRITAAAAPSFPMAPDFEPPDHGAGPHDFPVRTGAAEGLTTDT